jgi:hypothetical protein
MKTVNCVQCDKEVDIKETNIAGLCFECTKVFASPKELTFEQWVVVVQELNSTNIRKYNQLVLTVIQWNELKQIIGRRDAAKTS